MHKKTKHHQQLTWLNTHPQRYQGLKLQEKRLRVLRWRWLAPRHLVSPNPDINFVIKIVRLKCQPYLCNQEITTFEHLAINDYAEFRKPF